MGQNIGDSGTPLTVDSAALAIESLFPEEGDEQAPTATPEPEATNTPAAEVSDDDEVDTAPASDDESDDAVEQEEPAPQPQKHKVKVAGQDHEVTLEEALAGYSRTEDYTRKTQALSEKAKAFEAEQSAVRAERQQHADKLTELDHALTSLVKEPDWETLLRESPDQFAQVHAAWQIHERRMHTIRAERAAIEQQMGSDAAEQFRQHVLGEQAKLVDAIPEWKDEKTSKKDMAALVDYATGKGFSAAELNQVTDHRAVVMLRKAMLYDQSVAAKGAATRNAVAKIDKVKTATPGSLSDKPKGTELSRRMQRLKNSGRQSDAASAIELMLGDD